jgi:hypothetical protein
LDKYEIKNIWIKKKILHVFAEVFGSLIFVKTPLGAEIVLNRLINGCFLNLKEYVFSVLNELIN